MLTTEEKAALEKLRDGHYCDGAAFELGIHLNTVKRRLRSAREKMGAKTMAHAVALAIGAGHIEAPEC